MINLELIHRAVLEKLRFEKKMFKNCNLKFSEICGSIIFLKELDRKLFQIYLHKNFLLL